MKIRLILLLMFTSISLLTSYMIDRELYYSGFSVLPMPNTLPFGLKPQFENISDGNRGFYLINKNSFNALGKGVRHDYSTVKIVKVISYGFNDTILIGKVKGEDSNIHFFTFTKTVNKKLPYEVKAIKELSNYYFNNGIQWISVKPEKEYTKCRNYRNLGLLTTVILLALSIFKLVKFKNRNYKSN